jgi:SNF family Na+-dependent transporter
MKISRQVWPTQVGSFLVSIGLLTGLANMAFFPTAICQQGEFKG